MPSSLSALSASWVGWVSKGGLLRLQWKNCGPRMLAWGIGGASGGRTGLRRSRRFSRIDRTEVRVRALIRKRPVAGGLEPLRTVASPQPQDAEAGAEALLGVRPVAQDDVDEDRGGRPDAGRALAQHLGRDLGMAAMAGRSVIVQRGGAHVARSGAPMTGHVLAAAEDLDGAVPGGARGTDRA